jgi:hypothetical protein
MKTREYKVYYADGRFGKISVKGFISLEKMQEICQGYIQMVFNRGECMVINEEGKLMGLKRNEYATKLAHEKGFIPESDYIVGNAIVGDYDAFE